MGVCYLNLWCCLGLITGFVLLCVAVSQLSMLNPLITSSYLICTGIREIRFKAACFCVCVTQPTKRYEIEASASKVQRAPFPDMLINLAAFICRL